ncbi:MAG: tyrosine-protein phosphatase, partial [Trueperaceae bacterium]|nr:tyrosine-protein phosphatase [Trueperaceae bacterium]
MRGGPAVARVRRRGRVPCQELRPVRRAPLHVDLEGTVNTRDLGGWPLAAGGRTRAGRLLRPDAFTFAT